MELAQDLTEFNVRESGIWKQTVFAGVLEIRQWQKQNGNNWKVDSLYKGNF